jgi:hypothetical protein
MFHLHEILAPVKVGNVVGSLVALGNKAIVEEVGGRSICPLQPAERRGNDAGCGPPFRASAPRRTPKDLFWIWERERGAVNFLQGPNKALKAFDTSVKGSDSSTGTQ